MNVLIACEYSGRVREAFRKRGHNAWSCDLLPAEDGSQHHHQGDVLEYLRIFCHKDGGGLPFHLIIAHPPCTHLCSSGARWWPSKVNQQLEAVSFFISFTGLKCKWAIENPIGLMSKKYKKPSQIIQPHMFGHPEFKSTCLWLNGLPPLLATNQLPIPERGSPERIAWNRVHRMSPGPDRWKDRSRTYQGIADAMAEQWGTP